MSNGAAAGNGGGDDVEATPAGSSPKNRIKFLCSHGGKILPKPSDGHLKYVGGETRVIAVPNDINFSDLMMKLKSEFEGDMILKYQLIPEDIDLLVSVRTDEDLKHMLDECVRHESGGTAKLRAFLFPSNHVPLENHTGAADRREIEQRYIDAINDSVRKITNLQPPPINANRPYFSISACTSPQGNSPVGNAADAMGHESNSMNNKFPMHKVHSSPSLYNLNALNHQSNNHGSYYYYQHRHHPRQHYQHSCHSSPIPPHEHHRLSLSVSPGRPDLGRATFGPLRQYLSNVHNPGSSNIHNWSSSGHNLGSGNSNRHGCFDEHHSAYGYRAMERLDGVPLSVKSRLPE